jgi:iron(III) transport system substrate-binding protein
VPRQDFPKRYSDLLDPKWKGKLAVEVEDMDWFAGVVGALGEKDGLELFREIARTNGFSVRRGHTLLTNLVAAGEVPLALTNYNFTTEQVKRSGAPLEWFAIQPLMARPNGVGLLRSSSRPHAAVLFYDFVLGEAQPLLAQRGFTPIRKDLQAPDQQAFKVIDSRVVLDEGDKWRKLFQEIFRAQAR